MRARTWPRDVAMDLCNGIVALPASVYSTTVNRVAEALEHHDQAGFEAGYDQAIGEILRWIEKDHPDERWLAKLIRREWHVTEGPGGKHG